MQHFCNCQDMLGPRIRILPIIWKDTLNLPKTSFPPRPLPADRAGLVQRCADDLYKWQRANRRGGEYTLHDGPPYANGPLHIGHAFNKILKDITCRFQLSQGKKVSFVPGWDCHGLPIELKALERQKAGQQGCSSSVEDGQTRQKNRLGVRQAARKLATATVESQKNQFREWAIMADWDKPWTTMDKGFELKQLEVFKKLVQKGLIYRQFKPVFWSPSTKTALAEAELEYHDDVCTAAYVKFQLRDIPQCLSDIIQKGEEIHALIWTTMPWTLPANRAIGFHSELDYIVARSTQHGHLLFAKSRLAAVEDLCKETFSEIIPVHGSELVKTTYQDRAFDQKSPFRPFLHGDFVKADQGSGLVHLAPGHGKDDYALCLAHGITAIAPIDDSGRYTSIACPDAPNLFAGDDAFTTGQKSVLDRLSQMGQLVCKHQQRHSYPHDWRSKQPVIVRATEQWFANVGDVQADALQALESVQFIPDGSKTRLQSFVRNRNEWCISRQRSWGLPIPALYHKDTNEAILSEASISHIISVVQERGIDAWWSDEPSDPTWTLPGLREPKGGSLYVRGTDTMDVWFDSGSSWSQIANERQVADLYLEGTDQHRGWFQSSLLARVAYQGLSGSKPQAPFRSLVTHGFTLDGNGKKMSKSEGNVVSPNEITEGTLLPPVKQKSNGRRAKMTGIQDAMGPDALRLWVAGCDYTKDVAVSPTVLKAIHASLAKYRVTFKLLLGLLQDFEPTVQDVKNIAGLNHKIGLWQLEKLENCVRMHYQNMDYHKAVAEINKYVNNDFSGIYSESVKDAAYCGSTQERRMAQATLNMIFMRLQHILAPITPLLIQESWEYMPKQLQTSHGSSPFMREWSVTQNPQLLSDAERGQLDKDVPQLLTVLTAIQTAQEKARVDKKMGSSLQSFVILHIDSHHENAPMIKDFFDRHRDDLATLFVVSRVEYILSHTKSPSIIDTETLNEEECQLQGVNIIAQIKSPDMAKCVRCWRYAAPVEVEKEEALCDRCEEVVKELSLRRPEMFQSNSVAAAKNA